MDLNFILYVSVKFYSGKRKQPPVFINGQYCPHFVVKGDTEYLGVSFIDGDYPVCFDTEYRVFVLPIYEGINYEKLMKGTTFFIMEGSNMVGEGSVEDLLL